MSRVISVESNASETPRRMLAEIRKLRLRFYELLQSKSGSKFNPLELGELLDIRVSTTRIAFQFVTALCVLSGGRSLLPQSGLAALLEETVFFSTTTTNPGLKSALVSELCANLKASTEEIIA